MTQEIKTFLNQLEKTDKKQYFRLFKFYLNPSTSLGGNTQESLTNYEKYGDISHFILNNTFLQFLQLCLKEAKFTKKLDDVLLTKIRFILLDSKEYHLNYRKALFDPQTQKYLPNKKATSKQIKKHHNIKRSASSPLQDTIGFIYELEIEIERIKELNIELINSLIKQINTQEITYYETYILPTLEKETILDKIIHNDYTNPLKCFLYNNHGKDRETFQYLVCDNDFLKIIKEYLLPQELPYIIIDNIIEILEISINFKTLQTKKYYNFSEQYKILGKEKINKYHYKEALSLLEQLKKKQNNLKIIPLQLVRKIN